MIGETSADLLAKIQTVPALTTSTSFTLGGKARDPGLLGVPLPACWPALMAEQVDEQDYTHGPGSGFIPAQQNMLLTFSVLVIVPYTTDADLFGVQLPLLESVVAAVHGTQSPSGLRWRYFGVRLIKAYPDRLSYEQRYTLNYVTNSSV